MHLRVNDLSYTYPGGQKALDGVSFEVGQGESLALVGPNGAGKTTLFLCLSGVLSIPGGAADVAGLDPAERAHRHALPSKLGIIFQDSDDQLFSTTVSDDVAFGPLNLGLPPAEVRQRMMEALNEVGLKGFEGRVPFHLS